LADLLDDIGDELFLIVASVRDSTLCLAMLPQHTADPALQYLPVSRSRLLQDQLAERLVHDGTPESDVSGSSSFIRLT
jgi:hypothetical protein